jgi:dTDP-4-amino-4,6-dideoxygalactose transaminase
LATLPEDRVTELLGRYRLDAPVYVTRPTLPPLDDYVERLREIWSTAWLTNAGPSHRELERQLGRFLEAPHLSLIANGTIALLIALKALGLDEGEVLTTPFTFPATVHVLRWAGLTPVFCDVEEPWLTLDPAAVEAALTPRTRALLPVHVYGNPCDVDALEAIARRHGLAVLYDAAHTFGARWRGRPVAAYGDAAALSFHATKLFTTCEGGAVVVRDAGLKRRVDLLKNFGIANEETVVAAGINGKMNELQAAFGLLHLRGVEAEIAARARVAAVWQEGLAGVEGLTLPRVRPETVPNHSYFPVRIDPARFGASRDDLQTALRRFDVHPRKYFFPLCSHYPDYRDLPSAAPERLPAAERAVREVLCLPIYGGLETETVADLCNLIRELQAAFREGAP